MSEVRPRYSKAPIVEAVIDIRTAGPGLYTGGTDAVFADELRLAFPLQQAIHRYTVALGSEVGLAPQPAQQAAGWKMFNAEQNRALLLQDVGFTYSHMPPYTHWEVFRAEAFALWNQYIASRPIGRVTRLAARYINRLKLPLGRIELDDFLAFQPNVPEAFGAVAGLFTQVKLPPIGGLDGVQANVTIASEAQADPAFQPMVLDIDVFCDVNLNPSDPAIWDRLDSLREKKNQLFEAALTESFKGTLL